MMKLKIVMNKQCTFEQGLKSEQTVFFEAVFFFDSIDRMEAQLPRVVSENYFLTLEEMLESFRKLRKARAHKDRATSGKYRLHLSDHGHEVCKDPYRAEAHSMVGEWFAI